MAELEYIGMEGVEIELYLPFLPDEQDHEFESTLGLNATFMKIIDAICAIERFQLTGLSTGQKFERFVMYAGNKKVDLESTAKEVRQSLFSACFAPKLTFVAGRPSRWHENHGVLRGVGGCGSGRLNHRLLVRWIFSGACDE